MTTNCKDPTLINHPELSKLKEYEPRKIWKHEQYDFSTWLADNIDYLWDELDLSFTDVETERFVGAYRCDIICKDEITGRTVLIENQLEPTNHDHLWKTITYASWLDAGVVIWIVERAREEHRRAIEWLNNHTDDWVAFFLVEIHVYTIWNSAPAAKFEIIEKPNDFVDMIKQNPPEWDLRKSNISRLEFWSMLNDVIEERWKPFNKQKPSKQNWFTVSVGSKDCHISIDLINTEHRIRIRFWIADNKELYDRLAEHKEEIEKAFWKELIWDRLDDKKASSIHTFIDGLDFNNQSNYHDLMNRCIDEVVSMRKAFKPYL